MMRSTVWGEMELDQSKSADQSKNLKKDSVRFRKKKVRGRN